MTTSSRLIVEGEAVRSGLGNPEHAVDQICNRRHRRFVVSGVVDPEEGEPGLRSKAGDSVEHGSTAPHSDDADPSVTVRVGPLDRATGFYVADDGPGIDPSERESVFEPGHTTADDGTGFGLAIVREIAAAHGWTLSVDDADGARFEFRTDG